MKSFCCLLTLSFWACAPGMAGTVAGGGESPPGIQFSMSRTIPVPKGQDLGSSPRLVHDLVIPAGAPEGVLRKPAEGVEETEVPAAPVKNRSETEGASEPVFANLVPLESSGAAGGSAMPVAEAQAGAAVSLEPVTPPTYYPEIKISFDEAFASSTAAAQVSGPSSGLSSAPDESLAPSAAATQPAAPVTAAYQPSAAGPTPAPAGVTTANRADVPGYPRPVRNWLEAQIALARRDISSGPIDGKVGPQTRTALRTFQRDQGLPASGELDAATKNRLTLDGPAFSSRVVSTQDLASLQPLSPTWLGKSQQSSLAYQDALELVAEQARAHPRWLRQVNPRIDWTEIKAGTRVLIPDSGRSVAAPKRTRATRLTIHLAGRTLQATDANGRLLAHFPVSIAHRVEKRPVGELHVTVVAPNPDYTFDPAVFPESEEARSLGRKLMLPPGPNNPVGLAWIGLDRPGYGIHGTPEPQNVGRTESHGCFRLANWDALILLELVGIGTPVDVVE